MNHERPKQYLPLAGATVVEHALAPLLRHACLKRLVVVLAAEDDQFGRLSVANDERVDVTTGGEQRVDSVLAGLEVLKDEPPDTLVLVHDAARPCLSESDLERLLAAADAEDGALLAVPVRDTLKRSDGDGRVANTVDRAGVWQALTPQAFGLRVLRAAIGGRRDGVTDEASAMEQAGHAPRLVEGEASNIKITRPHDLTLAEAILRARQGEH